MPDPANILVVDDDPAMCRTLCDILEVNGYSPHSAGSGEEAAQQCESRDFAVVLVDLRLPDMPGTRVLERIRTISPFTEAIVLTGHASLGSAMDAVLHQAFAYVEKPVDPGQLLIIIGRAEEKRRLSLENRRLIEELRTANEELGTRVAERTRELARANEELQQLGRLRSAFIDVTSHELRTPLVALGGMLGIIERRTAGSQDHLSRPLEIATRAAKRLEELVVRVSESAREAVFSRHVEGVSNRVEEIVADVAADVAPLAEQRSQTLTVELPGALPSVVVDAHKIRDAVLNLVMNAINFTPDGGAIRVAAGLRDSQAIEVRISDTGIGVHPDDQPHVFEEFFTGSDAIRHTSDEPRWGPRGIGLGLAIVREFVEMHGGEVGFESQREKGSTFWFTLPLANAERGGSSEVRAPSSNNG